MDTPGKIFRLLTKPDGGFRERRSVFFTFNCIIWVNDFVIIRMVCYKQEISFRVIGVIDDNSIFRLLCLYFYSWREVLKQYMELPLTHKIVMMERSDIFCFL